MSAPELRKRRNCRAAVLLPLPAASGRLAAGRRKRRKIQRHHAVPVGDEVWLQLGGNADRRPEGGAEGRRQEREHGGIGPAGRCAHEVGLAVEEVGDGVEVPHGELGDLVLRVAADPVALDVTAHLPAHDIADQRAERRRRAVEEPARAGIEILIDQPPAVQQREIEVLLAHLRERPGDGPLRRRQLGVEIDAIAALQVEADEGRIRDDDAAVVDVRQLALRRLAETGAVGAVRHPSHLQQHLGLGHERAGVG